MQNIVNRLDDMLLFQDVSINDVNEVVEKVGNIFKHTSASVFGSKCKKSFCEKNKLKISHGLTLNLEKKDRLSIDVKENTIILKQN